MRTNTVIAMAASLTLAACAGARPPADSGTEVARSGQPPRNQCHLEAASRWVGKRYEGLKTLEAAREAAGADAARALRPDSVISKEYQMGRLNLVIDTQGRVTAVHCG